MASTSTSSATKLPTLGLLTFDLDDTLFPIGPVLADANEAMISAILALGYQSVTNADVLAATKTIRNELSEIGTPITYTDLRTKAIQVELERALERLGGNPEAVHSSVSERVFDTWLTARHESAERNLYPGAMEMFETVKAAYPNAVIGAVTNGRGDPLDMRQTLRPYFDFTISGEDEDVFPHRKPAAGIYQATLAKHNSLAGYDIIAEENKCWIHVGDDLANDVGASAACGALAIWYNAEVEGGTRDGSTPFYSTASAEEIERRKKMAHEAEKLVSRQISSLEELPGAIEETLRYCIDV
mmetsp:Transcript_8022/g.16267  ORF Transcript_8022/g.16267 Transcript_8022/m.16267 type:complete len:300 (-) Transcript_8022:90-989(-)